MKIGKRKKEKKGEKGGKKKEKEKKKEKNYILSPMHSVWYLGKKNHFEKRGGGESDFWGKCTPLP